MGAPKKITRGWRVVKFIEKYCVVPEGSKVGQKVKLADFQIKFILDVYDNPHITDEAILSIARKNAKTGTIAFLVLAHVVGPEAVQNSRIVSGARSREQAAEVYNYASKCAELSPLLRGKIRTIPSQKKIVGLAMNVEYQAISADAKTAHGKSPIVAILDEVGQVVGPTDDFIDAIETAQGAYENPLMIYISTQAQSDADFFSLIIDNALLNKPPKTVCHLYETPEDADLLDEEKWKLSNPALGLFRSLQDMRKQAKKAVDIPSTENRFRNLNLNQRVSRNTPLFSKNQWKKCGGVVDVTPDMCEELYGGLDLSKRTDLTAFVLLGKYNDIWYAFCWFWLPARRREDLIERSKKDRTPYDLWANAGLINVVQANTINYRFIAKDLAKITKNLNIKGVAFDRWRMDVLKEALEEESVDLNMIDWGQGFKDMAPAIDAIEEYVINNQFNHGDNPVLTMCMANSMVISDPAENRKLDKTKTSGRIDGMVALAMAAGLSQRGIDSDGQLDDFINNPIKT